MESYTAGYVCYHCGTWVDAGEWHTCSGSGTVVTIGDPVSIEFEGNPPAVDYVILSDVLRALERIAGALERLAGGME